MIKARKASDKGSFHSR